MGSLLCDARRLVRRLALDCQVVVIPVTRAAIWLSAPCGFWDCLFASAHALDVHLGKGGRQYLRAMQLIAFMIGCVCSLRGCGWRHMCLASIVEPAPRAGREAAQGGAASDHFVLLREDELCGWIPSARHEPVTVRLELWGALGPFRAGGFAGSLIGLGPAPQLGLKLP